MADDYTLETRLARVEQRVSDLDNRVTAMTPVVTNVVQLTERVETLRRDLANYATQVAKLDSEIERREIDMRKERREARFALWSLTVTILGALIGAGAIILTSVH